PPAESLVAIHLLSGRHWTPITGGVCIKKEGLSNRRGVPGVPGEEIYQMRSGEWGVRSGGRLNNMNNMKMSNFEWRMANSRLKSIDGGGEMEWWRTEL